MAPGAPTPPVRPQYPRWLWVVGFVVALVVGLAVAGIVALGGDGDGVGGGSVIEQLLPANNSKVLQQEPVGIDLAPGYTAALEINGVVIPDGQLDRTDPLNLVLFQPGPGKVIEQFPSGQSCVVATYWRLETGPRESTARSWCFTVL